MATGSYGNYTFSEAGSEYLDNYDELGYNPRGTIHPNELLEYEEDQPAQAPQEPSVPQMLREQNELLRQQNEIRRQEALAQMQAMQTMANSFQNASSQTPSAQQAATTTEEVNSGNSFSDFWNQAGQQPQNGQQAAQAPPTQQQDPRAFVRSEVHQMGEEAAQEQARENALAQQFRQEFPEITAAYGNEILYDWNSLKKTMPNATLQQRYEQLKRDAQVRYGQRVMRGSQRVPPNHHPSRGQQRRDPNNPFVDDGLSPAERMRKKNLETAKDVNHRRKKRSAVTSQIQ